MGGSPDAYSATLLYIHCENRRMDMSSTTGIYRNVNGCGNGTQAVCNDMLPGRVAQQILSNISYSHGNGIAACHGLHCGKHYLILVMVRDL